MKNLQTTYFPTAEDIKAAAEKLNGIAGLKPLEEHTRFSKE